MVPATRDQRTAIEAALGEKPTAAEAEGILALQFAEAGEAAPPRAG